MLFGSFWATYTFILLFFIKCPVVFHLQMFFFFSFNNYQYVSFSYIQLSLSNRVATFWGKGCQVCLLSVFLWMFHCICLLFTLMLRIWFGSDSFSFWVHLFTSQQPWDHLRHFRQPIQYSLRPSWPLNATYTIVLILFGHFRQPIQSPWTFWTI